MSKTSLDQRIEDKNINFFYSQGMMMTLWALSQGSEFTIILDCYVSYVVNSNEQGEAAFKNRWYSQEGLQLFY